MGCGTSTHQQPTVVNTEDRFHFEKKKETKKNDKKSIDEFEELTVQPLPPKTEQEEKYKCGAPTFISEDVTACFDNGLLYRIVKDDVWAFYNDTRAYQMHAVHTFGQNSVIRALGNTTVTQDPKSGEYVADAIVYPCETVMYVKGSISGFKSKIKALPLSEEYLQGRVRLYNKRIEPELTNVKELAQGCKTDDEILAKCVRLSVPFVDINFPPNQLSITREGERPMKTTPWARPEMYLPEGYPQYIRLFRNKIDPMKIDEGDLGDCWVSCAIATLAENPEMVRSLFHHPVNPELTPKERAVGAYRVTLNKNGWWRNVIVDDYLPTLAGRAKFCKSNNDPCEMWISVLEKAFAKLHGSYASIVVGDPLLALQDFTGYPTTRYDESLASDIETGDTELLERLERYNRNGFKIVLSTPVKDPQSESTESRYKDSGLQMGHAYTVTAIHRFEEEKLSLVQIRNPWSRGVEWKGDWNHEDRKWIDNPKITEVCGRSKPEEGTLWMAWSDVQKYFNGCGVVFTHPSSNDYRIRGSFTKGFPEVCLQLTVKKKMYIGCNLCQEDRRGTPKASEDYPPIMLSLACGRGSTDAMQVEQNTNLDADHPTNQFTFMQSRDVSMLCTLTPENSPYLLIPRMMSEESTPVPYVVGLFCEEKMGSDVKVEFRTLAPEAQVFNNFPAFSGKSRPVVTEYQVRRAGGSFPVEYSGKELTESSNARKKTESGAREGKGGRERNGSSS